MKKYEIREIDHDCKKNKYYFPIEFGWWWGWVLWCILVVGMVVLLFLGNGSLTSGTLTSRRHFKGPFHRKLPVNQSSFLVANETTTTAGRNTLIRRRQQEFENRMEDSSWPPTPDPSLPIRVAAAAAAASSDSGRGGRTLSSEMTVPAVMVAIASSIIICAMALCVVDLFQRCRPNPHDAHHPQKLEGQQHRRDNAEDISMAPDSNVAAANFSVVSRCCLSRRTMQSLDNHPTECLDGLMTVGDSDEIVLAQSIESTVLNDDIDCVYREEGSDATDLNRTIHSMGLSHAVRNSPRRQPLNGSLTSYLESSDSGTKWSGEDSSRTFPRSQPLEVSPTSYLGSVDSGTKYQSGDDSSRTCPPSQPLETSLASYLGRIDAGTEHRSGEDSGRTIAPSQPSELSLTSYFESLDSVTKRSDEDSGKTSPPSQPSEVSLTSYLESLDSGMSWSSSSVGSNGKAAGSAIEKDSQPPELQEAQCLRAVNDDKCQTAVCKTEEEDDGSLEQNSQQKPYYKSRKVARNTNTLSPLKHLYKSRAEGPQLYSNEKKLTLLEELIERDRRIPTQECRQGTESLEEASDIDDSLDQTNYVRGIFVPLPVAPPVGPSRNALGVEGDRALCASRYPYFKGKHGNRPRLFEGDMIMGLNPKQTAGHRLKETE